jgi:hypothetical protein
MPHLPAQVRDNLNSEDSAAKTADLLADAQAQLAAISSKLSNRLTSSRTTVERLKNEFSGLRKTGDKKFNAPSIFINRPEAR